MQGKTDVRARRSYAGVIEIETETVVTRAGRGAGAATITAIVQALKAPVVGTCRTCICIGGLAIEALTLKPLATKDYVCEIQWPNDLVGLFLVVNIFHAGDFYALCRCFSNSL